MPYTTQLLDAKNSTIKNIAGVGVDSSDFADLINDAQRRLMRRGNWFDTEWVVRVCIQDMCVTWPRYVKTFLGGRFQCDVPGLGVQNRWYSIRHTSPCSNCWSPQNVMEEIGTAPCYREISTATGVQLRYHVAKSDDLGKSITIYGTQYGGQPLQTRQPDGTWTEGITISATNPASYSTELVTHITSIVREATQGLAWLFEYDPVTGNLIDLGMYEPTETNPRYRRSKLHGIGAIPQQTNSYGTKTMCLEALVKLNFIPAVLDTDFLFIDNLDALKFMVQAIKAEEANDENLAEAKIIKAIRELNFEDRDRVPYEQMVVTSPIAGGVLRSPM